MKIIVMGKDTFEILFYNLNVLGNKMNEGHSVLPLEYERNEDESAQCRCPGWSHL